MRVGKQDGGHVFERPANLVQGLGDQTLLLGQQCVHEGHPFISVEDERVHVPGAYLVHPADDCVHLGNVANPGGFMRRQIDDDYDASVPRSDRSAVEGRPYRTICDGARR